MFDYEIEIAQIPFREWRRIQLRVRKIQPPFRSQPGAFGWSPENLEQRTLLINALNGRSDPSVVNPNTLTGL